MKQGASLTGLSICTNVREPNYSQIRRWLGGCGCISLDLVTGVSSRWLWASRVSTLCGFLLVALFPFNYGDKHSSNGHLLPFGRWSEK